MHYRYHNSCNSLLDNSAIVQGLSGTVILPGTVQATASQTIHLPRVVTVQASASAEVDNQPTAQHQHKRGQGKKPWPVSESDEIDLSAFGNAQDSNSDCHTKARAEATTNIVQVQMAADQKTIKDSVVRPLHHGYNRTLKIHPETSTANSCTCSEGTLDQRIKTFAAESHSRDCILNENAKCAAQPKDSVINENAVLFTKRTDTKSYPQAQSVPANVQIQVSANAASSSRTAVARAECSSTHGSLRTVSSQTRSSPGIESMGRASTAQSQQEHSTNVVKNCWQKATEKLETYSLSCIARDYYGPWLQQMPVKVRC